MRKLLLIVVVMFVGAVVVYRQRLFLRDPLGKVFVNGGQVAGASVFINYSNDVLVMRDGESPLVVQGWDGRPGSPTVLKCVRGMACLTDGDRAGKLVEENAGRVEVTNRMVSFADGRGRAVRVVIR